MSTFHQPRFAAIVPIRRRCVTELKQQAAYEAFQEAAEKAKVDQLNRIMDQLVERETEIARQIARLQKRKAATCARLASLERRTLLHIERCGVTRLDGIRTSLATRPATAAVEIMNEALIPDRYLKIETTAKPVKALIKAALSVGEDVPGVRLVQGMSLIRK